MIENIMEYLDNLTIELDYNKKLSSALLDNEGRRNFNMFLGEKIVEIFPQEHRECITSLLKKSLLYNVDSSKDIKFTCGEITEDIKFKILIEANKMLTIFSKDSSEINSNQGDKNKKEKIIEASEVTEGYNSVMYKISKLSSYNLATREYMYKCFELVGNSLGVNKIYIFDYSTEGKKIKNIIEWSDINQPKYISEDFYKWVKNELKSNQVLHYSNVENINNDDIRERLIKENVKSILIAPIFIGNAFICFEQTDLYRQWTSFEINNIHSLSIIASNNIKKISKGTPEAKCDLIIDKIKKIEYEVENLVTENKLLNTTIDLVSNGILLIDKSGIIKRINKKALEIFSCDESDLLNNNLTDAIKIVDKHTDKSANNIINIALNTLHRIKLDNLKIERYKSDTLCFEVSIIATPLSIKGYNGDVVLEIIENVELPIKKYSEIKNLSDFDSVTGLFNREYFEDYIDSVDIEESMPISIIMGDVNGLKMTNDIFGHQKGDKLLKSIADAIKKATRPDDLATRWGGDEFVILLKNTTATEAKKVCNKIKSFCIKNTDATNQYSISLGYATKNEYQENITKILKQAEDMMYKKKLVEGKTLRNLVIKTIQSNLDSITYKDKEHIKRVKAISLKIANLMKLTPSEMDRLKLLATYHDIGNVVIKNDLLKKERKLSKEEWDEIKRHCEIGCRIMQTVPELAQIADSVLSHHERWDGKGYPQGLKNTEIPILARIITIADAFDAMTNKRPYNETLTIEQAKRELIKHAGTQFDPDIVKLFVNVE
ncbi:diguanylate cyclase [Clostridiaceae bacterium M8S5]|nr:diguanylate cyclase [Clostridiaceae bacterium M8S5]